MSQFLAVCGTIAALITSPLPVLLQADPTPAGTPSAPALPAELTQAERDAILTDVASSMAAITTAQGIFQQWSADFSQTTGRFAMSRPGKMRFEYDAPNPLLLVSDGTTVAIQDSELETTDRIPLGSTPLKMILANDIDFQRDAEIVDVIRYSGRYEITLRDTSGEVEGLLTLIVTEDSKELVGWRASDSSGNLTSVDLMEVKYGSRLNPRLFILKDFDED